MLWVKPVTLLDLARTLIASKQKSLKPSSQRSDVPTLRTSTTGSSIGVVAADHYRTRQRRRSRRTKQAFLLFVVGCIVTRPLDVTAHDAMLMCAFGASFAAAVILWTEGTRLVSAAESGLLGSAEVPLDIFFAWLLLGEVAPVASLVGGAIVMAAVFGYAAGDFRKRRLLPAK